MRAKGNTFEIIGILAMVFLFVGCFVCLKGWLDGRWLMLFIGLPFVVVVIPDTIMRQDWKGLIKIYVLLLACVTFLATLVASLTLLYNNRWVSSHRWVVPTAVLAVQCLFWGFVYDRKRK
jgi:hypothetical protein